MGFFSQKRALVLGGGGARGIAHLGLLKFFEERKIDFDFIAGSSAGALTGAVYLQKSSAVETLGFIREKLASYELPSLIQNRNTKPSAFRSIKEAVYMAKSLFGTSKENDDFLKSLVKDFSGGKNFEDLRKPFYVVATDLVSGRDIVFSKGELESPLYASSAIAGVFSPLKRGGRLLVDGGYTQKLPVTLAHSLGASGVIASDVGSDPGVTGSFSNAFEIIMRTEDIVSKHLDQYNKNLADVLLSPDVKGIKWYEYSKIDTLFKKGYECAAKSEKELLSLKRKIFFFKRKGLNAHCCEFIRE